MVESHQKRRLTNKVRSRLTSDPYAIPGLDGRTSDGRRYRDIVESLLAEFGARFTLKIRELAMLKFTLEQSQFQGDCSLECIVQFSNTIAAQERDLREVSRMALNNINTPSLEHAA